MKYDPEILLRLFSDVAEKADLTLEHNDIHDLADEINLYNEKSTIQLSGEYLYEAHRKTTIAFRNKNESIEFSPSYINCMIQYLGYLNFKKYLDQINTKIIDKNEVQKSKKKGVESSNNNSIIAKTVNKFEGDLDNTTINNF